MSLWSRKRESSTWLSGSISTCAWSAVPGTSASRWRSPSRPGACACRIYDINAASRRHASTRAARRSWSPACRSRCDEALASGTVWSPRPTGPRQAGRARGRGRRHPGRPAPQPGPPRGARGWSATLAEQLRPGQLVVLRSTVYPGVTRRVEKLLAATAPGRRRGLLPRADRRGPGDDRAVHAAADRRRADRRGAATRAGRAVRASSPTPSSSWSPRRPSSPSCSPTPGATSSSPRPTSST